MDRLSASFVLGYHGCDQSVAERLLAGERFTKSANDYDWLGSGAYFWEANPRRGLDFAREAAKRSGSAIEHPSVVGAIIDLGDCLDLMSLAAIEMVKDAHTSLLETASKARRALPENRDRLRRQLDCAVIEHLHTIYHANGKSLDSVRAVFVEDIPIYPGSGFDSKTHIQIAVRNLSCIKGVFRVKDEYLAN